MNFDNVITFMGQQAKALKELEDLITHDARQEAARHKVKPEDIETLRAYVTTMKTAVETATALAKYYKGAGDVNSEKAEKVEKPKKNSTKKEESLVKEEPAKEAPPKVEPVVEEFDFLD